MTHSTETYQPPGQLEPGLDRIRAYWDGLKRGGGNIPFSDDVKVSMKASVAHNWALLEAFENPNRFRFDLVSDAITQAYGSAVAGKFVDEIDSHQPFDELASQCMATIKRRQPTYYRHASTNERKPGGRIEYARLILPLWGNGRVEMLIVGIEMLA